MKATLLAKMCFEKMLQGISEMVNARACKPLPLCFSTPENLLLVDIWSSQEWHESHFVSKNVFWENAAGYLRNGEWLELANLCHCVQYPWTLTSRDFSGALGTQESHFVSKNVVLRKCCGVISEMVNARAFKPLPFCSATLEILIAVICGALGIKKATFLSKYVFWENAVGYLRNGKG